METIRNYLNAMFAGLPDTPEVRRAYEELAAMMEDKYTELIEEGRSENEAVGTVISEFGNLDELAQSLGIEDCVKGSAGGAKYSSRAEQNPDGAEQAGAQQSEPRSGYSRPERYLPELSPDEVCAYIADSNYSALLTAVGVFLCITAPVGAILTGDLPGFIGDIFSSVGVAMLFIFVAAAVAFFRMAGGTMKPWKAVLKEGFQMGDEAWEILSAEEQRVNSEGSSQKTLGIILCITCVIPPILFGSNFGAACMFIMVGAGVFLIVRSSCKKSGFKNLRDAEHQAAVSDYKAGGGQRVYVSTGKEPKYRYEDKNLNTLMTVYWEAVTCVYFGWSFLTGMWATSWLIWILAGIVKKVIQSRYGIPTA